MKLTRRTAILATIVTMMAPYAFAKSPMVYTEGETAIDGTDTVAYWSQGKAVAGSPDHTVQYKGSTWMFSSAKNKAKFEENPEAYAPQYGGYCAYAMAQGYVASTVPEAWTISDSKLYLNYSKGVQRKWEKDISGYVKSADGHWPDPLDK